MKINNLTNKVVMEIGWSD